MNPTRRHVLRAAGVSIALPLFDAALARPAAASDAYESDGVPRRLVCVCNSLGLHGPNFVPEGTGRRWKPSRYLKELTEFRGDMTVLSGVSHPEVDGGHIAEKSFLTTAPHPSGGSFRNTVSLDQYAAEFIGRQTRYPSIVMSAQPGSSLSWTRAGVPIPGEKRPLNLFQKLFMEGSKDEVARQVVRLKQGRSIMDTVLGQTKSLGRTLGPADRRKFDEYLTSVREVERQMASQQDWAKTPKPKVKAKPPSANIPQADIIRQNSAMLDLARLAIQTDQSRVFTILTQGLFVVPPIEGVEEGYHTVSHHGMNKQKLEQLALIETEQVRVLRDFCRKLKETTEQGQTLLDRTVVFYGSNLGNASSHDNRNLPALLLGGGFRHGQHLAFDRSDNEPLANLYVSMVQRLGINADRFGTGTRTLPGLEPA